MSGIAYPFNGQVDEFRISHVQRFDGWSGDISRQVPVYLRIHSAIDITTAHELGAD